jgi:glycosyltransferase involved in cell wall biosynthesis
MNVVFFVHAWAGTHNSGAEWTVQHYAKYLHQKGCNIEVILPENQIYPDGEKFAFIKFITGYYSNDFFLALSNADVVFTHLDNTGVAINWTRHFKKHLVFLSHNDHDYRIVRARQLNISVVYNNKANEKNVGGGPYPNPSIVCKPPIFPDDVKYNRKHGQNVTLINCNENKGGKILVELAKRLPKIKFLGVLGSYGEQIIDDTYKNLKYVPQTPDIHLIYGKSNIVLMPSDYESYGRVALEAAINRLPVICTPTDGLKECLGAAGLYFDREDIDGMAKKIEELMTDEILYDFHQNIMRNLAEERLKYQDQELEQFYTFIVDKAKRDYNE